MDSLLTFILVFSGAMLGSVVGRCLTKSRGVLDSCSHGPDSGEQFEALQAEVKRLGTLVDNLFEDNRWKVESIVVKELRAVELQAIQKRLASGKLSAEDQEKLKEFLRDRDVW